MRGMGGGAEGDDCPFSFNFDPASFKPGDTVSYRVSTMEGFPFVGTLLEVHPDWVLIAGEPSDPSITYRATRESRPLVDGAQIG